jgi:hypothetical protein
LVKEQLRTNPSLYIRKYVPFFISLLHREDKVCQHKKYLMHSSIVDLSSTQNNE